MKRPLLTSRTVTRIAFGVIIVFVLAQVVWWIIFQERYIRRVTQTTLDSWQQTATTATRVVDASTDDELAWTLLWDYPYLLFDEASQTFSVDPEAAQDFVREQRGFTRMFSFEGPFFVLVVLGGLYIIARSLATERELKRRQQNFLSAITHEFKTPISTLRLLIETALMRSLPAAKQQEYLHKMESELSRLEQTSEQVLASARLEGAREAPVLEPLELNSVVQGVVGKVRGGLEARGARLVLSYSPDPLPVSIDPNAFGVVLNNLLDNAAKYSSDPAKRIHVKLEAQGDLILTHVSDEGMGISEKERAHIFERFYRVGNEMTRESKGVGLGLHLVKSITEAMNGWVKVEANVPKGTRFSVILPRRVALSEEEQAQLLAPGGVG